MGINWRDDSTRPFPHKQLITRKAIVRADFPRKNRKESFGSPLRAETGSKVLTDQARGGKVETLPADRALAVTIGIRRWLQEKFDEGEDVMESVKFGKRKALTVPALILGSALVFGMFGCDRGSTPAGKYQNDKQPQDFTELKSDGTFLIKQGTAGYAGKYTISGNKLTLSLASGEVVNGSIEGKTITDNQGEHWTKR